MNGAAPNCTGVHVSLATATGSVRWSRAPSAATSARKRSCARSAACSQVKPARIFCREFHAELVAVAGNYKVLEDIPKELRGKAVQVWLDGDTLRIEQLD